MKNILFIMLISFLFVGCYYDKADVINPNAAYVGCDTTAVTYSTIQPIISSNCYNCHSGTASAGIGIALDSYTNLKTYITSNPGLLERDINWTSSDAANNMPSGGSKLSDCNINKIVAWINQGLKQ